MTLTKIPPSLAQVSELNIAKYSSEDGTFMHQAFVDDFNLLQGCLINEYEGILQEEFREKVEEVKKLIENYKMWVGQIEFYLSGLNKGVIDAEDITSKRFVELKKRFSQVNLYNPQILRVYLLMIQKTNLINKEVSSSAWKRIHPDQKRINMQTLEGQEMDFDNE